MEKMVGAILQRDWDERRSKNADLQPMSLEAAVNLLDFGDSKFCTGWLVAPPNIAPTYLVPGLNEANRSEVRLLDACHMKAPGNEGTLYSGYRPDANRSLDAMGFVLRTDVENASGWALHRCSLT